MECDDCDGSGAFVDQCPYCFGTGVLADGRDCDECSGTGEEEIGCETCYGTGSVDDEEDDE